MNIIDRYWTYQTVMDDRDMKDFFESYLQCEEKEIPDRAYLYNSKYYARLAYLEEVVQFAIGTEYKPFNQYWRHNIESYKGIRKIIQL